MNKSNVRIAVRYVLAACAASAMASPAAFAQNAQQGTQTANNTKANTAAVQQLGKVEVTGTRILRSSVETAQPITIINAQQIKATGLTTIGEVLQNITQSGGGTYQQIH